VWHSLSEDDRAEYFRLRASFEQNPKMSSKDRRVIAFPRELQAVLSYLERSSENKEARCIVTGLCFVGAVVCINTRQLKRLLNRCKSSINGSFQQLGYVAVRTKSKARSCAVAALPALERDQSLLRQWTCRVISDAAPVCFVSTFADVAFPQITEADLLEEKRPRKGQRVSFKPRMIDADLPGVGDFDMDAAIGQIAQQGAMSFSFSMDCCRDMDGAEAGLGLDDVELWSHESRMAKSKSADLSFGADWDFFADGLHDSQ
jgi:hypothetical protein